MAIKSSKALAAKKKLEKFALKINKELEKYFDTKIIENFRVGSKKRGLDRHIWRHIKDHNLRPAKRLRGSFVFYSYKLFCGGSNKEILKASMSVELIHTALLMHDDFMDQDVTRRGKPTTHEYYKNIHLKNYRQGEPLHYGESMAVAVGDIALLAGYEILGLSNFPPKQKIAALNRLLRGIVNTSFGQAFDLTLEAKRQANEKDIFDLHLTKTAIYTYENPLHIGAILAGAKEEDLEILSKYALPGGIAFQLQDDILGLYGDPKKTGKSANSDLKEGKLTLLIIKSFENGTKRQIKRLKEIWGKKDLSDSEAEEVRKIVIETGSLDYSKKTAVAWAKKAQDAISTMYKKGWNKEAVSFLDGIAQYMVEREL